MFRTLLTDRWPRLLFNPALGVLGGLSAWALFEVVLGLDPALAAWDTVLYFTLLGLGIGFACNLLRPIQDGAGVGRTFGTALVSGLFAGAGGGLAAFGFSMLAARQGFSGEDVIQRWLCYLVVGTFVGLSCRLWPLDKATALGALGGLGGGSIAIGLWIVLGTDAAFESYTGTFVSAAMGATIGAATYSLPSFVSGGTLQVLTGQFKGQRKEIEDQDVVVGNNKRQLQWVLPKWEGVQDPHARVEVRAEGRGYRHSVKNLCGKTVVVVRSGKKLPVRPKTSVELQDQDVIVLATGKSFVKVRYHQRADKG